ncbi:chorismate-binding protein [Micromonospora sp. WMMD980]|uniref:chorismate-binding protein n=1 Tax=Micromonospora sp. WMMD980 TaxID=3016088 RepID=UPI00241746BA|nr:chorismate-binding protein [Micromonospora sp. WMMD980]MDG4800798.1 chorismate-binding protein [Micromonospora sp. WMMD980]
MSRHRPDVVEALPQVPVDVPGAPPSCRSRLVETARLQWRLCDGGDPADLAQGFLAAHGVPVDDLTRPGRHTRDGVCGAALFLSAAAGAYAVGAPTGARTPIPALPDLVVVVYRHAGTPPPRSVTTGGWWLGGWRDSWTPAAHAAAVEAVRAAIARGDVYQVNLVGHAAAGYAGDPRPALRRLASLPGARYGGTLAGPGWALGCASPETLVAVEGGRLVTRPIKGTRPATAAGRRELLASAKERAEHVMIVDLERNDLARVARTGSVRVDELFAVRRWCDLWQAESTVSAAPADGLGLADLLRAVCPGGSVTGAPKHAALAQVAAFEPVGRGAGMGALGWVGPDRLDLGLTIRTAAADADRLHLWAGGGITWGSDPAAEVAEAAAKAAPVRALLAAG